MACRKKNGQFTACRAGGKTKKPSHVSRAPWPGSSGQWWFVVIHDDDTADVRSIPLSEAKAMLSLKVRQRSPGLEFLYYQEGKKFAAFTRMQDGRWIDATMSEIRHLTRQVKSSLSNHRAGSAHRGRTVYYIDLAAPPSISEVRKVSGYPFRKAGMHPATLFRYGRRVADFMLTDSQWRRVLQGKGRIEVRQDQIDQYQYYAR